MNREEIIKTLTKDLKTATILEEEPMKKHTSFKVGGIADLFIRANNIEDIQTILQVTKQNKIPLSIIGNGSNILVRDKGIRGVVLQVDLTKQVLTKKEDKAIITVRSRS